MGTSFSYPFSSPFQGSGFTFVPPPTRAQQLGQNTNPNVGRDRMLDPVTLDYIRTTNGEWAETSDSRTIVLIALSVSLGESPFDPQHGTSIRRRLKNGIGLTSDFLQAETVRVGEELRQEGILSELTVAVRDQDGNKLRDEAGRPVIRTQWRDLASGSPIDATFTPR